MKTKTARALLPFLNVLACISAVAAEADTKSPLDPSTWPASVRQNIEQQESRSWTPTAPHVTRTKSGIVVATVSPLAVEAGRRCLEAGGTAADAATTIALTQITTGLGSVVSYAGIVTALYYDATTGHVSALDAGYATYADEKEPLTIPRADLGSLQPGATPEQTDAHGRKTLVPGFMAGIEALHKRHGRLPFAELFSPAIWYAENGVAVSPVLAGFFAMRAGAFNRTAEGRAFLAQSGRALPEAGDRFRQPALAATLRAVAKHGAQSMYTGDWAKEFVAVVRREGGRASEADLAGYAPVWTDAYATQAFGHTVHVTPLPNTGAYSLVLGLNLAEETKLSARGPVWRDAAAWSVFSRIAAIATTAPLLSEGFAARLRAEGCDTAPASQLTKDFARKLASLLPSLPHPTAIDQPRHSNAIVVVDAAGNICVLTHTINAVVWGGSGLVVGGIPLPDSAGFQQARLAYVKPGGHVPHEIVDTIVLRNGRPVLATAGIGSSLAAETLRILVSTLAQNNRWPTCSPSPPSSHSSAPLLSMAPPRRSPCSSPTEPTRRHFLKKPAPTASNLRRSPPPPPMRCAARSPPSRSTPPPANASPSNGPTS